MKRFLLPLLLLLLLSFPAFSQVQPQIRGAGTPSPSTCATSGQQYLDTTNHVLYNCSNGTWVNIGLGNLTGSSFDPTTPGAIGGTTPAAGSFTTLQGTTYKTTTKCAAAGSAANPSAVACSAAPSGSFSCATNASTGTCVVSTTAVTAASAIFVQPDSSLGSLLSVTCNTTADTGLTGPRVSARTAATSFTITLGTFTTNPLCFNYWVVN